MFKPNDLEKLKNMGFEVKENLRPKWKPDYQGKGKKRPWKSKKEREINGKSST